MICGKCGNPENAAETKEGGFCGICNADNWIEWNDFYMDDLRDYINEAANHLGITKGELVKRVYKSLQKYEVYPRLKPDDKNKRFIKDVFKEF